MTSGGRKSVKGMERSVSYVDGISNLLTIQTGQLATLTTFWERSPIDSAGLLKMELCFAPGVTYTGSILMTENDLRNWLAELGSSLEKNGGMFFGTTKRIGVE